MIQRIYVGGAGIAPTRPPAPAPVVTVAPPAALSPAPEPLPPLPASEVELRALLTAQVTTKTETVRVLNEAQQALARGETHYATCAAAVETFEDLEALIAAETARQLAAGDPVATSTELRQRIEGRRQAQANLSATGRALDLLSEARDRAAVADDAAAKAIDRVIRALLALHGDRLVQQRQAALDQAATALTKLRSLDQFIARSDVKPSEAVQSVLFEDQKQRGFVAVDTGVWQQAAAALRSDPATAIEV